MSPDPVIFLVDDDEAILSSTALLLELEDMHVRTFASAEEFLSHFEPVPIGCLLLDVRLPGMSGLELQQHLNAKGVGLPVILISGHADEKVRSEGFANGALELLVKPVASKELIAAVRATFDSPHSQ